MTETVRLAPHDPIPSGPARHVVVLHRFDEDAPQQTITTITLTGHPDETTRPMNPDGRPMNLEEAIDTAKRVAESEFCRGCSSSTAPRASASRTSCSTAATTPCIWTAWSISTSRMASAGRTCAIAYVKLRRIPATPARQKGV